MSAAAQATTTETVKTKPAAKSAIPATFYVLDTTAIPGGGKRAHEMMVDGVLKTFEFEPGKGLEMDRFVALKFLNIDAFKRVDEKGNLLPFRRPPKQPHELGAGEQFKLADEETVAHFDELSTPALQHRVTAMPGGELFAQAGSRSDMIAFIVAAKKAAAKANISTSSDMGRDDFLPAPDFDEEAA